MFRVEAHPHPGPVRFADDTYPPSLSHFAPLIRRQTEVVHFPTLDTFQDWYQGLVNGGSGQAFVNVPLGDFEGEYLVIRPEAVIGVRVEPQYASIDDA